ncbi:MAG: hypothetical protein KDA51_01005, partial [Planctomycetales bacterium]|nr:hypothetical protein [Planctomycetales bacterium]
MDADELSLEFRKLAERFRRIHAEELLCVDIPLESSMAWGGKLCRQGRDAGCTETQDDYPSTAP